MLNKNIDPEPVKECPECSGKMILDGDEYEGTATCEQCGISANWDKCHELYIPEAD